MDLIWKRFLHPRQGVSEKGLRGKHGAGGVRGMDGPVGGPVGGWVGKPGSQGTEVHRSSACWRERLRSAEKGANKEGDREWSYWTDEREGQG